MSVCKIRSTKGVIACRHSNREAVSTITTASAVHPDGCKPGDVLLLYTDCTYPFGQPDRTVEQHNDVPVKEFVPHTRTTAANNRYKTWQLRSKGACATPAESLYITDTGDRRAAVISYRSLRLQMVSGVLAPHM